MALRSVTLPLLIRHGQADLGVIQRRFSDSIHTLTKGKGIAVPPGALNSIFVPGCRFPASSTLCTKPPGRVNAVMSLFSKAAGAFQIDQLNQ